MADGANRFGLKRTIPSATKREIRTRSKFGCVLCRRGFYTYEHIDPLFKDAKAHDPSAMCCLCWACQDAVTRGHISKASVLAAYKNVQAADAKDVGPPVGPLDFHDGSAELRIGAITYQPAVRTLLRYHGTDLIRVSPSTTPGEPGAITATFTDDSGHEIFWLRDNEWIGSTEAWDIDVTGARITVRRKLGQVALQLRLDPPGRIVVERLDMRFRNIHVLATDATYAIGRYIEKDFVEWMHADLTITGSNRDGAAFEFTDPWILDARARKSTGAPSSNIQIIGGEGAMLISQGMCIGSGCSFMIREWAMGPRRVSEMREVLIGNFGRVPMFIGKGITHE